MNQGEEAKRCRAAEGIAGTEITKELLLTLLPTSMGLYAGTYRHDCGRIRQLHGNRMRAFIPTGRRSSHFAPLLILMVVLGLTDKVIPKRAIFHGTNLCIALEAIGNRRSRAHRSERARLHRGPHGGIDPRNRIGVDLHILLAASLPRRIMYHGHHHRARSYDRQRNDSVRVLVHSAHDPLLPFCDSGAHAIRGHRSREAQTPARGNKDQIGLARLFPFSLKERRQRTVPRHYCHRAFLMSIAIGFFERLPDGAAIPFTRVTRLLYALLIDGVFIGMLWGRHQRQEEHHDYWRLGHYARLGIHRPFAVHNFPDRLDIGAVFGNAMNVTMTGFILYLIIAFSSYGHRDTYYYAIAGWAVFILPRSIVRVSSIGLYMQFPQPLCQRRCAAGCCSFPPSSSSFNSLCSNETKPLQPKRPR